MSNVFITGATGGIGVPTVRMLASQGHRVFAGVRDRDLARVFDDLTGVIPVEVDVTDETSAGTNRAWRRFIALNYIAGFLATMILILAWVS